MKGFRPSLRKPGSDVPLICSSAGNRRGCKEGFSLAFTMSCGYSTGTGGGYMPVEAEYGHAGYEVDMTPSGTKAAEGVIREMSAMYKDLH